jgi:tetratricopeptide (TPR) repeat protein
VYQLWIVYAYPGIDFYEAYGQAVATADRAVALDSDLAEAYAARGRAMTVAWAPAAEIAGDFTRALELRPNSPDVHQWYAGFLTRQGRHEEALAEMERAVALDPLSSGTHVGFVLSALAGRRYDLAEREAARAAALEPSLWHARGWQALGDLLSGNAARCATRSLGPDVGARAMCLYSLGRVGEAARIADSLRAAFTLGTAGDSLFSVVLAARGLAEYYAWTGNAESSLAWLERAYAISPEGENSRVIASGIYDKVRNDPRFKTGLERIHTQIYDRVRRARRGVGLK